MSEKKRYLNYFIADVHLGLRIDGWKERERAFAKFLMELPEECEALYFLGDLFDFWYEYKDVVPKVYSRTLGALASLADRGVKLYFIKGNHDLWVYRYFQEEIGVVVLEELSFIDIGDEIFCLAHGDELTGERGHLVMKWFFKNRVLQRLLSALHPRITFALATNWSKRNRLAKSLSSEFKGEKEPLYGVASEVEKERRVDHFIFAHLHSAGSCTTPKGASFNILGEWVEGCQYLLYNSQEGSLVWQEGALCKEVARC